MDTARIEEVVSDFVSLKKRGVNYIGLCPFHNEKTPSFTVSAAKGIYKCFGCGKGGHAVNFVMEHEHYTYPEALKHLAKKYNIEIEEAEPTPEYQQEQNEKESLYTINQFAQKYFTEYLLKHETGKAIALTYLQERDFTEDSIEKFQLGFCPETWSDFTNHALKNGFDIKYLVKSGLTVQRDGGDHFDRFRGRVIFPVHNLSGRILGFGGRIIKNEPNKPKYVNSPESDIYVKSKVLYGIFLAKNSIISNDNCFLVEGYTDVISFHQAGIQHVVASSGTSLTVDQIRLIKRYTENVTILYDGDEAGLKASFRGIDLILEQGMNVKVVMFPEGDDPDSYARKHRPAELKSYLSENAKDFIKLKTNLLIGEVKNDPVKKAVLIKSVVETISLIPAGIKRSVYIKECSELMLVEEPVLLNELNKMLRKKSMKEQQTNAEDEPPEATSYEAPQQNLEYVENADYQEREIIRLLLAYGDKNIVFDSVDEHGYPIEQSYKIAGFVISDLSQDESKFDNNLYQQVYEEMIKAIEESGEVPDSRFFTGHPNKHISELSFELLSQRHELSENWKKNKIYVNGEDKNLKNTVIKSLFALKAKKIKLIIKELQRKIKVAANEEELINLLQENLHYKELMMQINKELSRVITP
jgi:DNA primase